MGQKPDRWTPRVFAGFLLLFAFLLVAYAPALPSRMAGTDDEILIHAPQLQPPLEWRSIRAILTPGSHLDFYPLRDFSHLLDNLLWGDHFTGHRLHALVLMMGISILAFFCLRMLGAGPASAFLLVALWTTHPAHAEMLVWLSARKDVLSIFLGMASLACFLRGLERENGAGYPVALLLFATSLLSKASIGALPFAGLLGAAMGIRRLRTRGALLTCVIAAAIGTLSAFFQAWFYSNVTDTRFDLPFAERVQASAAAFAKTIGGWLNPGWMVVDLENWGQWVELNHSFLFPGLACFAGLALLFGHSMMKRRRGLALVLAVCLMLYLPVSGLIFPLRQVYSLRYFEPLSLAALVGGGALLIAYVRLRRPTTRHLLAALATLGIFLGAGATVREARLWADPVDVLLKALEANPESISLKIRALLGLKALARKKPLDSALHGRLQRLDRELAEYCSTHQRWAEHCWLYDYQAWHYGSRKRLAADYMKRLFPGAKSAHEALASPGAVPRRDPVPRLLVNVLLAENLRDGVEDRDALEAWLILNTWHTRPDLRLHAWSATCLARGSGPARQMMHGFLAGRLLDRGDVAIFLQKKVHRRLDQNLRACLPTLAAVTPTMPAAGRD